LREQQIIDGAWDSVAADTQNLNTVTSDIDALLRVWNPADQFKSTMLDVCDDISSSKRREIFGHRNPNLHSKLTIMERAGYLTMMAAAAANGYDLPSHFHYPPGSKKARWYERMVASRARQVLQDNHEANVMDMTRTEVLAEVTEMSLTTLARIHHEAPEFNWMMPELQREASRANAIYRDKKNPHTYSRSRLLVPPQSDTLATEIPDYWLDLKPVGLNVPAAVIKAAMPDIKVAAGPNSATAGTDSHETVVTTTVEVRTEETVVTSEALQDLTPTPEAPVEVTDQLTTEVTHQDAEEYPEVDDAIDKIYSSADTTRVVRSVLPAEVKTVNGEAKTEIIEGLPMTPLDPTKEPTLSNVESVDPHGEALTTHTHNLVNAPVATENRHLATIVLRTIQIEEAEAAKKAREEAAKALALQAAGN
jgi:hypothetical protein